MNVIVCRWCPALAVGRARGSGHPDRAATGPLLYCDAHYERAAEIVRPYPVRNWEMVQQPQGLLF